MSLDIDAKDRLDAHREILKRKRLLRKVFHEFHEEIRKLDEQYFEDAGGLRIELGAGVCPIRNSFRDVLSTDIVPGKHLDEVVDSQQMPFADGSVRAVYGQNCFHHFPDPGAFLRELERVLVPKGGAVLIEPYHGPVASLFFKYLFASEEFDKKAPEWKTPSEGPMRGANGAISYIIFERDREEFNRRFTLLEIAYRKPLINYLRYFLSGGLNFRQIVPDLMEKPLAIAERALSPLSTLLALHYIIVLRRKH